MRDEALQSARHAEGEIRRGFYRGPLHGIPVAVKDLVDTAGTRTTSGSKVRADYVPRKDAAVIERLRAAGAVIIGKTVTYEFAYVSVKSPTRNPWNLDRQPGGSSAGSGAAVSSGMCLAAIGTDTGGSIRVPSCFNGIVGLKPTYGLVSKRGVTTLAWTMDHVGPMTKTVEDAAIVLNVIAGFDRADPASIDFSRTRCCATARARPLGLTMACSSAAAAATTGTFSNSNVTTSTARANSRTRSRSS